jgi:hypothetical protein
LTDEDDSQNDLISNYLSKPLNLGFLHAFTDLHFTCQHGIDGPLTLVDFCVLLSESNLA